MKRYIAVAFILLLVSCRDKFDAKTNLGETTYHELLLGLAPYVNKKPKSATMEERFDRRFASYYEQRIMEQQSEIRYYVATDSVHYFFYVNKDLTSLYEHYRGHGGYFVYDDEGAIKTLNILYYTPRWTKEEVNEKGRELFEEMLKTGNVKKFMGNRDYIQTPNNDFYYDVTNNLWQYTENSSWKFLEAREKAEKRSE
jgi:hypothetical protein